MVDARTKTANGRAVDLADFDPRQLRAGVAIHVDAGTAVKDMPAARFNS